MRIFLKLAVLWSPTLALASNFSGFSEVLAVMAVSSVLAIESLLVIVLAMMGKFNKDGVRRLTNIFTAALYFVGIISALSFLSSRGVQEIGVVVGMLFASGIVAVILPNVQRKKNS